MFVAIAALLRHVVFERCDQGKRLFGSGHGDVQQATFLLDHRRLTRSELGWEVAVGHV